MSDGGFGLGWALIILAPYIVIGALFITGIVILKRSSTNLGRRFGAGLLVLLAVGIAVPPLINALRQNMARQDFIALSNLPETIDMHDATVLFVGMQDQECGATCRVMLDGGHVSNPWFASLNWDTDPVEALYHAGPMDLTTLNGFRVEFIDAQTRRVSDRALLPDKIDFIHFEETHWLEYHDPDVVFNFPEGAYQGQFLYKVNDARAFDLATAKQVAAFYQATFTAPKYLWFSQATNDRYQPSNAYVAELLRTALCRGAASDRSAC